MTDKFHSEATSGGEAVDLQRLETQILASAETAAPPTSSGATEAPGTEAPSASSGGGGSSSSVGVDATDEMLTAGMGKSAVGQAASMFMSVHAETAGGSSFMPGQNKPGQGKGGAQSPIVPMGYAEKKALAKKQNRAAHKASKTKGAPASKDPIRTSTAAASGSAPIASAGSKARPATPAAAASAGSAAPAARSSGGAPSAAVLSASLSGEAKATLAAVRRAQENPEGARLFQGLARGDQDAELVADQMMETSHGQDMLEHRAPEVIQEQMKKKKPPQLAVPAAPKPPSGAQSDKD